MNTPEHIWKNQSIVYARINLKNKDLYIGSTENWNERFQAHTREAMKHFKGKCKGCGMHHAYKKQGGLHPSEWVMIPIRFSKGGDMLRDEIKRIYRYRSNLNKEIYGGKRRDNHNSRRNRNRGAKKSKSTGAGCEGQSEAGAVDTTYTLHEGEEFVSTSLVTLMGQLEQHWYGDKAVTWVRDSKTDTTNWKLLDFKHGQCEVEIEGERMRLRGAINKIKKSTEGEMKVTQWDLRSTTKATEALLVKLGNKKWKIGEFTDMSAAQHKSIWVGTWS